MIQCLSNVKRIIQMILSFFIRDRIFIDCVDDDNLLIDMNDAKIPNKINRKTKRTQHFVQKINF